jgi:hypothetical protein
LTTADRRHIGKFQNAKIRLLANAGGRFLFSRRQ